MSKRSFYSRIDPRRHRMDACAPLMRALTEDKKKAAGCLHLVSSPGRLIPVELIVKEVAHLWSKMFCLEASIATVAQACYGCRKEHELFPADVGRGRTHGAVGLMDATVGIVEGARALVGTAFGCATAPAKWA
jgi:hypothetical protein